MRETLSAHILRVQLNNGNRNRTLVVAWHLLHEYSLLFDLNVHTIFCSKSYGSVH